MKIHQALACLLPIVATVSAPCAPREHILFSFDDEALPLQQGLRVWVVPSEGIRVATWERDRLGYLQPFVDSQHSPHLISTPVETEGAPVAVKLNVAGLNQWSQIKVSVLDRELRPVPGYGPADCTPLAKGGFEQPVTWGGKTTVRAPGPIRLRIDFGGIRPEDIRLYAVYIRPST